MRTDVAAEEAGLAAPRVCVYVRVCVCVCVRVCVCVAHMSPLYYWWSWRGPCGHRLIRARRSLQFKVTAGGDAQTESRWSSRIKTHINTRLHRPPQRGAHIARSISRLSRKILQETGKTVKKSSNVFLPLRFRQPRLNQTYRSLKMLTPPASPP